MDKFVFDMHKLPRMQDRNSKKGFT